jgi:Nif-specific regulatory protein
MSEIGTVAMELESVPCLDPAPTGAARGVVHLPVAPRCNLRCTFCDPACDCVHTGPAGLRSTLLGPGQALRFLQDAIAASPGPISAVAVTGPGDPLASAEETFATLRLVHAAHPDLPLLVGTNGLALVDFAEELVAVGVRQVVVGMNAMDPAVGGQLLTWARLGGGLVDGPAAAQLLRDRQLAGIAALARLGIRVRVNLLVMPGVNDFEVGPVAQAAAAAGASLMQIAVAPGSQTPVPETLIEAARVHLPVASHCRRCPSASMGCLPDGPVVRRGLDRRSRDAEGPGAPALRSLPGLTAMSHGQLALLARIASHLAEGEDTEGALAPVLHWLSEEQGLKRGVISLADEAGEVVEADIVAEGVSHLAAARMRYRTGEGVTGRVLASGQPVFLPQLGAEADFLDRAGLRCAGERAGLAFFCVPIAVRGAVVGTLSCDKDNHDLKQADGDLALLLAVARLVSPFVARRRLEDRLEAFQRLRSAAELSATKLLGRAKSLDEVRRLVAKVASSTATVLITGETGTGKGVVARLIHELSPRKDQPQVEVNCGAIPENLIESELFGHEKGAFTGALARRPGVFERARGGTVFLDEVGELPMPAQTRLLRVLQTRTFERVGGSETLTSQARVVAATNRDLEAMVKAGTFRADLFYRLSVFPIGMPALRDRGKADVMLLADAFVLRFAKENDKAIFRFDTPAIDMLTAYHWPGNVRELENVIERSVVLAEAEVIHGHHLPPSLQMNRYASSPEPGGDFATRVSAFELELITEALKDAAGNQTKAAEVLGMTKRVMQYKCQLYGIDWRRFQ